MEYEIETAHGRLFCRREGSGPSLLLIHGVACDSEFFRETSKLLAETFTVISYDRRGYSRSIAAEGENDFSVWAHAEDAAEIIRMEQKRKAEDGQCPVEAGLQSDGYSVALSKGEENQINECCTGKSNGKADQSTGVFVAGCSAGGAVAAALATKYPELVRQVFLHEPLMRGSGELAAEQDAFWEKLRKGTEKHRIITCMMHFVNAMGGV